MIHALPLDAELLAVAIGAERDAMLRQIAIDRGFLEIALRSRTEGAVLLDGDQVMLAAGVTQIWFGLGEAWMFVSRAAGRRHLTVATLLCRERLDRLQQSREWRRVQMWTRLGAPWCRNFARRLGMTADGVAAAWDPAGRDYVLWSRVVPRQPEAS